VTAEFAVVLTGVLAVLALCVSSIVVIGEQVALSSLASSGARMLARGEDVAAVRGAVASAAPGAVLTTSDDGHFVCVAVERSVHVGTARLGLIVLHAKGCALAADPLPDGLGG